MLTQALAFLPQIDVLDGFKTIKEFATINCEEFLPFLTDYIEKYYIGTYDERNKKHKNPYFSIETWNLYDRIMKNFERTNNKVERWNKEIQNDAGDRHLSTFDFIENLRLEQGHTEA